VLEYKDLVESLFMKYDLPTSCYEIVPDIQKWCKEHGIEENNPHRAAKCLCQTSDSAFHIVFNEVQTDSIIYSAKSNMALHYGFEEEVAQLDTDLKYLEHLILHEISCKILETTEQELRDRWAFQEMGI
jgi:hypothetical protein